MAGTFPALPVFIGRDSDGSMYLFEEGWKDCMISFLRVIYAAINNPGGVLLFANEAKAAFGSLPNKTKGCFRGVCL